MYKRYVKNSTSKSIKCSLTKYFLKVSNIFGVLDHNLYGIYETINVLSYFY